MRAAVERVVGAGASVEVTDSGGVATSADAGGTPPGSATLAVHVRVVADDPSAVDPHEVDAAIAAARPAHVPHTFEIVGRPS